MSAYLKLLLEETKEKNVLSGWEHEPKQSTSFSVVC